MLRKFKTHSLLFMVIIWVFGFYLRLVNLGELPAVMHRDEAAIAYNAYSLLKTGMDEWGMSWPLSFRSFGDYKLPGLIYSTLLGIHVFGLNPLGARVVTAILGSISIPLTYWFSRQLGFSKWMGIVSSFLLSLSFWHVGGSRNVYEPVVALTLSILVYGFLYRARERWQYLLASVFWFGLSIWFYHTTMIVYPLLFLIWMFRNWKVSSINQRIAWLAGIVLVVAMVGLNQIMLGSVNASRSSTVIFFSQEVMDIHQQYLHRYWSFGIPLHPVFKGFEYVFEVGRRFLSGYVSAFSPYYIFFTGGNNYWHNLANIGLGNENIAVLPFWILGAVLMYRNWHKQNVSYLVLLFLLTPIPNALTVDSPNTNRLMEFHWIIILFAALAVDYLIQHYGKMQRLKRYVVVALSALYILFAAQFLMRYFILFNRTLHATWNEGFPELMGEIEAERLEYDNVELSTNEPYAYIHYAFYTKLDPAVMHHQTEKNLGASHMSRIRNVYFNTPVTTVEYDSLLQIRRENGCSDDSVLEVANWEGRDLWCGYLEQMGKF